MCVIMVLPSNVMVPWEMFQNATWNNEDGYGILIKDKNRFQLFKECPEEGNDPDKIYKILEEHKGLERYVHLRHKTEGGINIENTQPFCTYKSNKREVWFMHNGTLYEMKSNVNAKTTNLSTVSLEGQDLSDSNIFNQKILRPMFARINGDLGKGDIQDPFVQSIIQRYWSTNSRGILISSDQEPFLLERSSWSKLVTPEGEILASNNDYFESVRRGREYDRRKKKEDEERAKASSFRTVPARIVGKNITSLECSRFNQVHDLSEKIVNILEEVDLYSEEGLIDLANLTYNEFKAFAENIDAEDMAGFLIHISDAYKTLFDKLEKAESKKVLGEKKIEALVVEINKLSNAVPQGEIHVG